MKRRRKKANNSPIISSVECVHKCGKCGHVLGISRINRFGYQGNQPQGEPISPHFSCPKCGYTFDFMTGHGYYREGFKPRKESE